MNSEGDIKAVAEGDDKNEEEQINVSNDDVTRRLMKQVDPNYTTGSPRWCLGSSGRDTATLP